MKSSLDVTVVGDCCLDLVLYGLPDELPLERELMAESMAMRIGGSGAITAHNLSCLCNRVGFVFATANDSFGQLCRARLTAVQADTSGVVERQSSGTALTVLLQHQPLRHMFSYPGATASLTLPDIDLDYVCQARHFHLASFYLQRGLTPQIPELLRRIKECGLTVSMDTNDDPEDRWDRIILDALEYVDVFMPNEREAVRAAGEQNLDDAIRFLRQRVPLLIVKRGEQGASAYDKDRCWHVPAFRIHVIDAIGAGDSFDAGFLHGYIRNWKIERCLELGAITGAWSTTASGGTDAFFDPESREKFWQAWSLREGEVAT